MSTSSRVAKNRYRDIELDGIIMQQVLNHAQTFAPVSTRSTCGHRIDVGIVHEKR